MLSHDEYLNKYTTWRVGGQAKTLFRPKSIADLQQFLSQQSKTEPMLWLGLGSNTLVRDKGYDGIVVVLQGGLQTIEVKEHQLIRVEAGMSCPAFARKTARMDYAGLEFMAGIPGTIGGALRMNAGCYGGETWQFVKMVETINRAGEVKVRNKDEFEIGYRSVKGLAEDEWFVAGWFELQEGNKEHSLAQIKDYLDRRAATQPTGEYNCGSVFRNPEGNYAAKLIESCGLKGYILGDAEVSPKHANFITNRGNAASSHIEELIEHVFETVHAKTGTKLHREVHIVGEK